MIRYFQVAWLIVFLLTGYSYAGYQVILCDQDFVKKQAVLPQDSNSNGFQSCQLSDASNSFIVQSNVLLSEQVLVGGKVVIQDGKISDIICKQTIEKISSTNDSRSLLSHQELICPNTILSPAFVNAHEHLANSYTKLIKTQQKYDHRDDWRIENPEKITWPDKTVDFNKLREIELRHLLSGSISMASSQPHGKLLKYYTNKFSTVTLPFGFEAAQSFVDYGYKLSDSSQAQTQACGSLLQYPTPRIKQYTNVAHVGEGVNCLASYEIKAYLDFIKRNQNNLFKKNIKRFSITHGVAASYSDLKDMASYNISLIWSLTSNMNLYGKTAHVIDFYKLGGNIAFGTDWAASGSENMLQEIAAVMDYNKNKLNNFFTNHNIWQMVTQNSAYALGIEDTTGSIKKGLDADLILVNMGTKKSNVDYYEQLLTEKPDKMLAIWRSGELVVVDQKISSQAFTRQCEKLEKNSKYLCANRHV